jgi:hypothetical protein
MRDAGTMSTIERISDLDRDRQRLLHRQRAGALYTIGKF